MPGPPPSEKKHAPTVERRVWLPGVLTEVIATRMEELKSGSLSRYLVELIAYDLRERRLHSLTGPLARESLDVQQAVDLVIAAHYRPGQKSNRDQIAELTRNGFRGAVAAGVTPQPLLTKEKRRIYLRRLHSVAIRTRMRELGFANLSQYVTSLIRYDLLLGGPHKYFYGDDCTPEMALLLDRETLAAFETHQPRKCMIDYIVEETAGRAMSVEERHAVLRRRGEALRDEAVAAVKKGRKGPGRAG